MGVPVAGPLAAAAGALVPAGAAGALVGVGAGGVLHAVSQAAINSSAGTTLTLTVPFTSTNLPVNSDGMSPQTYKLPGIDIGDTSPSVASLAQRRHVHGAKSNQVLQIFRQVTVEPRD